MVKQRQFEVKVGQVFYDSKTIESSSRFVVFSKTVYLPFPPFEGLSIAKKSFLTTIESVHWSVDSHAFGCRAAACFFEDSEFDTFESWLREEFLLGWDSQSKIRDIV
jgi:hypothetical protein